MFVLFDHQHRGKPTRPDDVGAAVDLDGDGRIAADETEIWHTEGIISETQLALLQLSRPIVSALLCNGLYGRRHDQANGIATRADRGDPFAYLACHVNAGRGDYGLIAYDYRSPRGQLLAELIGEQLANLSELSDVRVEPASPENDWSRAYHTIDGIYQGPRNICGICLEPFFLDTPAHRTLATVQGLRRIGYAVAAGLVAFFDRPF